MRSRSGESNAYENSGASTKTMSDVYARYKLKGIDPEADLSPSFTTSSNIDELVSSAQADAASQMNPSGSVNGPASLVMAIRCDPVPSGGTPASLARARRL